MMRHILPSAGIIVFGIVVFSYLEGWDILTSVYVITQMVTTVGYGDLTVKTDAGKLFASFYAVTVLISLAYYYNLYAAKFTSWESQRMNMLLHHDRESKRGSSKVVAAAIPFVAVLLLVATSYHMMEPCVCREWFSDKPSNPHCVDTKTQDVCVATGGYKKSFVDAIYMTVITFTTIGFGDMHPTTRSGTILWTVSMLLGVAVTACFFGELSEWMFSHEVDVKDAEAINAIDEDMFKSVDADGSGGISRGEYLTYVLMYHGLIQRELLESIHASYDALNPSDSGVTLEQIKKASTLPRQPRAQTV